MVKILSYNIAGLANKTMFPNFFEFIKNYDIFFLHETFVTEEFFDRYNNLFAGFELRWVKAVKNNKYGRASGGGLYGYNKKVQSKFRLHFERFNDSYLLTARINEVNMYIVPVYFNPNKWEEDFLEFSDWIIQSRLQNMIIIGDMNVRIADAQPIDESISIDNPILARVRKSKDSKIDRRGRKLLDFCDDMGGIILNGRSLSDHAGEFTFVGSMGQSVNDICIATLGIVSSIKDFEVVTQTFSDHLPISIVLSNTVNYFNSENESLNLLPKLIWSHDKSRVYETKLERLIANVSSGEEIDVEKMSELVCEAAGYIGGNKKYRIQFKQKWYDFRCLKAREKSLNLLKLYRKFDSHQVKKLYMEANKSYKKLCQIKKNEYYRGLATKLSKVRNAKEWWAIAKELKGQEFRIGTDININVLSNYFRELLNRDTLPNSFLYAPPHIEVAFLDENFSVGELRLVLQKMKDGKAPGPDRIPYEFFKYAGPNYLQKLVEIFDKLLSSGQVPESFRNGIIFPLYKKGDCNVVSNYRGLTFLNAVAKIFSGLIYNRLEKWVEEHNLLNEYQAGFRKNYSTTDNIYVLGNIVKLQLKRPKQKVFAFFVDFKAAFDGIPRDALIYKLYNIGISSKIVKIIEQLYVETKGAVWNGSVVSDWFVTNSGVRQGCLLSPLLFALYLNDLHAALEEGISLSDIEVRLLMYADDIVLLADSAEKLQRMINRLEKYCLLWKLIINLEKSKIMVFRNGGKLARNERWRFAGEEIEVVKSYKYLGVQLSNNFSFHKHLESKLAAAKGAVNSCWGEVNANRLIPFSYKYKIYKSVSQSIALYGAQVWGFNKYDSVERLLRWFIKKLFGFPVNTPSYMIYIETGLGSVFLETLKLHFNYIIKVLQYPANRLPHIFAIEALKEQVFWVEEWYKILAKTSVELDLNMFNVELWKVKLKDVIDHLRRLEWEENVGLARASRFHDLYSELSYHNVPNYFCDSNEVTFIRLIFKVRGGLLNLNAKPWKNNTTGNCSLCNWEAAENTNHFIALCPALKEFRLKYFDKVELNEHELIQILNGSNYSKLVNYMRDGLNYRQFLINEYNC